jgi:hypothetical protein
MDKNTKAFERGLHMGRVLNAARANGENPDIRHGIADEARYERATFDDFMDGLDCAMGEAVRATSKDSAQ